MEKTSCGYYLMVYGGEEYQSVAWYAKLEDAELALEQRIIIGAWHGKLPRIEPDDKK